MVNINQIVDEVMNLAGMKNDFVYYSMTPFDIQEYILDHTLPEYSRILPYVEEMIVSFRTEDILENDDLKNSGPSKVVYAIPKELREVSRNGMTIYSIGHLEEVPGANTIGTGIPGGLGMLNYTSLDSSSMNIPVQGYRAMNAAFAIPRYTCSFQAPNKIVVDNGYGIMNSNNKYKIRVSFMHPRNLKTLTGGQYATFRQLAYYDVVSYILDNELKYMDQINLGNSTTDLKLALYEDVQSERLKFLEDLRSKKVYDSAMSFITAL